MDKVVYFSNNLLNSIGEAYTFASKIVKEDKGLAKIISGSVCLIISPLLVLSYLTDAKNNDYKQFTNSI